MERRIFTQADAPLRVEKRADGAPMICGYASVFYDAGDPGTQYSLYDDLQERVMPGAFDRAAREDDVRALFNHDPNCILGRTTSKTLRLSIDKKGLRYEIDAPDTSAGRDLLASVTRGDVTGSSFGFDVTAVMWRKDGDNYVREIHGTKLYDVSPVTYPAYNSTTAGIRSETADKEQVRRDLETWKKRTTPQMAAARARAIEIGL